MADLSKVKIGESTYNLKDAQARTDVATAQGAIADEVTRATGAESTLSSAITSEASSRATADSALDTRITALESKGRYLSTWDATTGLPETYPEVSGDYPKTYAYRSGDYYIVNKVAASGSKNYMPDGASITKQDAASAWVVGKAEYTGTLNLGDQFQYDGTKWTHIASATAVAFANIQGDADENSNLKGKLDTLRNGKVDKTQKIAGVDLQDDITKAELQSALDLKALAYKASASASYTPAGSISEVDATPAGSVTLNALTQTATAATISSKADYTPAGTVAGTVVPTGTVTLNAFTQTATDITSTGKFTPAGTVAAVEGGNFKALKTAVFAETSTGGVQIEGTVSKPSITVNDDTTDTFVKSLKAGDVDAAAIDTSKFSGGSFTGASQASFTQGAKASFTQGSKAALSTSDISYVEEGVKVAIDTTDTEMLVFSTVTAKSAKAVDTFTANGDDTFVANGDDSFTANNVGTFTAAAINTGFFTAQKLPVVNATAAAVTAVTAELAAAPAFTGKSYVINTTDDTALKTVAFTGTEGNLSVAGQYDKATANGASFTGNSSGDAITATFTGTKAEQLIPTGVTYDKATANGATFAGTTNKVTPTFTGTAATIEVE